MTHQTKLKRAEKHFDALERSIRHYIGLSPYRLIGDYQDNGSRYAVRVHIDHAQPQDWPELAGDCIHNLRAALDHMVWSLTMKTTNGADPAKPRDTGFPICKSPGDFNSRRTLCIGQTTRDAQVIIEKLQPYHGPYPANPNPLLVLKELDDIDKHRRLHFVGGIASEFQIQVRRASTDQYLVNTWAELGPLRDGADVFRADVPQFDPKVEVQVTVTFGIHFSKDGPGLGFPVIYCLKSIRDYVRDVVFPPLEAELLKP
jgi:hypothetical protein